ncbi:MAG: protein kinase [Myxococcales bacterium]|nr:protein kinase [Myxococcales bacterium]
MDGYPQGPQWAPGSVIGDFEIIEHVASGGMAEVYAAVPRGGGEPVVLKAMSRNLLANEEFVRLFLDEAQLIAALTHRNIGRIFDRGEERGTHYFVMEYVLGTSCRELLNRAVRDDIGHIPTPHAIDLCCDIATALHYAHERRSPSGKNYGIVHRDVSHSNVLVTYDGVTKLIDFGVAKSSMRSTETKVGSLKGKVRYMSPEQIRGEPLDRRSDLFSLGIMLWEMTTGHRLFRAPNEAATLHKILFEDVRRPSDALPGYPPQLERIVLGALAKKPADRPATGAELADQLTDFARRSGLSRGGLPAYLRKLFGTEIDRAQVRFSELRRRSQAKLSGAPLGPPPATTPLQPVATAMPIIARAPATATIPETRPLRPAILAAPATQRVEPPPMPAQFAEPPPAAPWGPVALQPLPPAPPPLADGEPRSASRTRPRGSVTRSTVSLLLFAVVVLAIIGGGLALSRRRPHAKKPVPVVAPTARPAPAGAAASLPGRDPTR